MSLSSKNVSAPEDAVAESVISVTKIIEEERF